MRSLALDSRINEAMVRHARFCYPEEACGLLATDGSGAFRMFYAQTNIDHSATSYTVDPAGHFGALTHAEREGWLLSGVFHSHPGDEAVPSARDVGRALEPHWWYFILGAGDGIVRAFEIRNGTAEEARVDLS